MSAQDQIYMREALIEARKSFDLNEVPVGAIIVYQNKIIARAHNYTEQQRSAVAHAEILCLQDASKYLENWRLNDATLYCTLEPCPMCAYACILSRIKRIVYGARDFRHGADGSLIPLLQVEHPIHQVEVSGGVLEEESALLLKTFFKNKRMEHRCIENCLTN